MNKFMMMVVLLAGYLWTDAANAQHQWQMYTPTDELTGETGTPYPIRNSNWSSGFHAEVEFQCGEDWVTFTVTTFNSMPHVFYNAQYGNYFAPIRVNWGNGKVSQYNLAQGSYSNVFSGGSYGFDFSKINPTEFKLELVAEDGQKYYMDHWGLTDYLGECKTKKQKAEEEANKTFEEKQNYSDAEAALAYALKEHIKKYIQSSAWSWDARCIIALAPNEEGVFDRYAANCDSEKFKDQVLTALFANGEMPKPTFDVGEKFIFEYNYYYQFDE